MCESLSNLYEALKSNDAEIKALMDKVPLPPDDHWIGDCTYLSSWEELMLANNLDSQRLQTVMTCFFDVPIEDTLPQITLGEMWNEELRNDRDGRVFAMWMLSEMPGLIYGILLKLVLYLGRNPNEPIPSCMQAPVAESQSHPAGFVLGL